MSTHPTDPTTTQHKGAKSYAALAEAANDWRYTPDANALANKNILITGAGDGIGAVAAKTLASFGANILLLGRTRQKLEAVFDWIEANTATQAVIVPCDLEQLGPDTLTALHDAAADSYGKLHGILHNASLLGPKVPLAHYPVQDWQRVMQTNVTAPFLLTQALFDLVDHDEHACIINTSSGVGRKGRAYWGAYSVSKFATEGFSQILADETESGTKIRVYSVNPSGTRTNMRAEAYPLEDPLSLPTAEQHMDLYLYLIEGPTPGKNLPPSGAQLEARSWQCQ